MITVAGHTDNQGETGYNQGDSPEQRYCPRHWRNIFPQRGIRPTRLVIQYFGQNRPIADNSIPSGRAENRRVELIASRPPIVAADNHRRNLN